MSIGATSQDFASVADVIDLNHDLHDFNSIDDDELKLFRRNLVTPAATVYSGEDDLIHQSMFRKRSLVPRVQQPRPISRGESVMLFKNINNGKNNNTLLSMVITNVTKKAMTMSQSIWFQVN
jgi:hypothetical protein